MFVTAVQGFALPCTLALLRVSDLASVLGGSSPVFQTISTGWEITNHATVYRALVEDPRGEAKNCDTWPQSLKSFSFSFGNKFYTSKKLGERTGCVK